MRALRGGARWRCASDPVDNNDASLPGPHPRLGVALPALPAAACLWAAACSAVPAQCRAVLGVVGSSGRAATACSQLVRRALIAKADCARRAMQ